MQTCGVTSNPVFMPGNVEPRYSEFLTFVGVSVDEHGTQHYLDSQLAYKRACLNAIEYHQRTPLTREDGCRLPRSRLHYAPASFPSAVRISVSGRRGTPPPGVA
jgi:hypothetical protein